MAKWTDLKPVDPKELQKKRRLEEKQRRLEEQARKAKATKVKVVAAFVLILAVFIGIGAFLSHRKSKARQAANQKMEVMELKLVSGKAKYSTIGVFEEVPSKPLELEKTPSIKTEENSRVELKFATGGRLIVYGSADVQVQEFTYDGTSQEGRVVVKVNSGRAVYRCEKNNRFYFRTDRMEVKEASTLGGSFEITKDVAASLDIVVSLDIPLKVNKLGNQEITLNPSYAFRIDNTGKHNSSFVSVSTRDW